jgi:CheY-like chemotaxis protein
MLLYSGKAEFAFEKINLSGLVQEMAELLEAAHSKTVGVNYRFEENLSAIEGDASQVRQVVMNLITNASEAIGDVGGSISIETGACNAKDEHVSRGGVQEKLPDGRYLYLRITDTGCGMDEERQRLIFDPFFTTKFTGRGLGLAAVLGIVHSHKAGIDINSEPGKGTTFTVFFPALNVSADSSPREKPIDKDWRGEGTILVVDDEDAIRNLTELVLKSKGFNVLTAADGLEAIDLFRKNKEKILLVLLDQTMPQMGGDETLIELRNIQEDVRAVLLSGYHEKEIRKHADDLGYGGFLKKPVDNDILLDTIHVVLEDLR